MSAVNGGSGLATPKPRILIPEKISPDGLALLRASLDIHEREGLGPQELISIIPEYDALIVRSETKVTAAVLAAGKKLKVVARAGVGVDNVDVNAATKQGIIVVNSPAGNINAAAEHTIALLMAVARNIGDACASVKLGKWERSRLVGVEVKGKSLAIIGLGKVGLIVARMAAGLGMTLVAYDPYANPSLAAAANVSLLTSLSALLTTADFLTIHTPLIASTKGMIGANELATMKPSARILNVARGGMIDEIALVDALDKGTIAGAGIDVFTSEPPKPGDTASRLIAHPKVVATPHLGASTVEAQENVSIDVCEQVLAILSGQLPRSAVNAPIILPEEYRTLQPFVSLLEKMGSLYTQHYSRSSSESNNNFRTTFDITYSGLLATLKTTTPLFAALVKGLLMPISSEDMNVNIVNAELVAKERGILINEQRSREMPEEGYSSLVTLRARTSRTSSIPPSSPTMSTKSQQLSLQAQRELQQKREHSANKEKDQIIAGFVSGNTPYISRLDRFVTNFVPTGVLLICRNYDSPGRIGVVGLKLGAAGVNINNMTVAPILSDGGGEASKEALMILGVDRPVDDDVVKSLVGGEGLLEAGMVVL